MNNKKRPSIGAWQRRMAEATYRDGYYSDMVSKIKREDGYVYIIHMIGTPFYKIGKSQYPYARTVGLANPPVHPPPIAAFELTHCISTDWQSQLERELHGRFQNQRVGGEWFLLNAVDLLILRKIEHRSYPLMRQMKARVEELEREFNKRMARARAEALEDSNFRRLFGQE